MFLTRIVGSSARLLARPLHLLHSPLELAVGSMKFRPFKTVKEAEAYAHSLGISCDFVDNLPMANRCCSALHRLEQLGVKFPTGLKIKNDVNLNVLVQYSEGIPWARYRAIHSPLDFETPFGVSRESGDPCTIYLSPRAPWRDIEKYMEAFKKRGEIPTAHPDYVITHEMGHAFHELHAGEKVKYLGGSPLSGEMVAEALGSNAMRSSKEFVADMFARRILEPQNPVEADLWRFYEHFHGHPLPLNKVV